MAQRAENRAQEVGARYRNLGLSLTPHGKHLQPSPRQFPLPSPFLPVYQTPAPVLLVVYTPSPDTRTYHMCGQPGHVRASCRYKHTGVPARQPSSQPPIKQTPSGGKSQQSRQPFTAPDAGAGPSRPRYQITDQNRTLGASCNFCKRQHHTEVQCLTKKRGLPPNPSLVPYLAYTPRQHFQQDEVPAQEGTFYQ